jgi:methylthioribose-1-phosphate isomerase
MFDWLIQNVGKRMEGEKLKALHHPFDTQMIEAMNNAVARRCPKNKMFAGSQSLVYRVASVAGQQTKSANKYMSDVYERLEMTMPTQQQTFWSQWQKKRRNDAEYKKNPKRNANKAK